MRAACNLAPQCSSLLIFCCDSRHRQALEAYPTTIDEDLALLGDAAAAPRGSPARTAIQVRVCVFMDAHHANRTRVATWCLLLGAGCPPFRLQVWCDRTHCTAAAA
jgi:Rubisco LSMT substrate-binding